jgi:hypothetical protein
MNIRSLFNLTKQINNHIINLPPKEKFNLLDIKPILKAYQGNDWDNYIYNNNKLNKIYLSNFNNYLKIPIKFNELSNYNKYEYEMFLLVWYPQSYTALHSHTENGCLMKILDGNILEQRISNQGTFPQKNELYKNDISYIHNIEGLHRIINNNFKYAYSLHIYS